MKLSKVLVMYIFKVRFLTFVYFVANYIEKKIELDAYYNFFSLSIKFFN